MRMRWSWLIPGTLAGLAAAAPAWAQPRVTLRLPNATLPDALKALQRESGWELKLERTYALDLPRDPQGKHASFDWSGKPVGGACREVAEAFGLTAQGAGLRQVEFRSGLPPAPKPIVTMSRGGYEIRLPRLAVDANARQEFGGKADATVLRNASLELTVRPPDGDPDRIYGILNLQVETDRGPADLETEDYRRGDAEMGAPDEWTAHVRIVHLPPRATEIMRLGGELAVYPAPPRTPIRLDLSTARPAFPKGLDLVTLRLNDFQLQDGRVRLNAEAVWGNNVLGLGQTVNEWQLPALTTQSGRIYTLTGARTVTVESGTRHLNMRLGTLLPRQDDPPALILWEIPRPLDDPERISFRFRRLPLPRLPQDVPAKPAPGGKP